MNLARPQGCTPGWTSNCRPRASVSRDRGPKRHHTAAVASLLVLLGLTASKHALAQREFSQVLSTNLRGQLLVIGNTIVECDADEPRNPAGACTEVASPNPPFTNNDLVFTRTVDVDGLVDLDGDGVDDTFNSSRADLTFQGSVNAARLYWWGMTQVRPPNTTRTLPVEGRGRVLLGDPSGAYTAVTSQEFFEDADQGFRPYLASADVTAAVQGAGPGAYTVANITTFEGRDDHFGGWALVVVNADGSQPVRHISVYDGYEIYGSGRSVEIPFSGFLTPPLGPIDANVTFVALDGDATIRDASRGDTVVFDGVPLSNALNPLSPIADFGNSTISIDGVNVASRQPNLTNTLGTDIDRFDVSPLLSNGQDAAIGAFSGVSGRRTMPLSWGSKPPCSPQT